MNRISAESPTTLYIIPIRLPISVGRMFFLGACGEDVSPDVNTNLPRGNNKLRLNDPCWVWIISVSPSMDWYGSFSPLSWSLFSEYTTLLCDLVTAKIHDFPILCKSGSAYCGRSNWSAGSNCVNPILMWPLHPRSFFSISTRKISPGLRGFSLKVSACAKLVSLYATMLSWKRRMFWPWYGWKRVIPTVSKSGKRNNGAVLIHSWL